MTEAPTGPVDAAAMASWLRHIGRHETRRQVLDFDSLRRYAAAVGSPLDVERILPPLAHWAYFLDAVGAEGLGADGHTALGGLIPPISLPRRLFAAAEIRFRRPLILGRAAELTVTVADVRHRQGRAGELVLVDLDRRLRQEGAEILFERQTIVYRAAGDRVPPVVPAEPAAGPAGEGETWRPGPVDLFRFSAATFNAHRIHYDLPYARDIEGYPGLVLQGPFTAARLLALARQRTGGATAAFAFRINAPLFAGQPVRFSRSPDGDEWHATRCDGVVALTARLEEIGADR